MRSAASLLQDCAEFLAPPPSLDPVDWAEQKRWIYTGARRGPYRTDWMPYIREPAACCVDPAVERVTVMKSTQVGFTELALNILGRYADLDPSQMMYVGGSDKSLDDFSKIKLARLLQNECFDGKLSREARGGGDNLTLKFISGQPLVLASAASPRSLRMYDVKILIMDERDAYPASSGSEGDPGMLAIARTESFDDRLIVEISTPTNKGASPIETAFLAGDQRYYWVPCPHCGEMQRLHWRDPDTGEYRVTWPKKGEADPETGDALDADRPDLAFYVCKHNGCVITDADKPALLAGGQWRAERPFRGHASFHLSALYSPMHGASFGAIATDFVAAVRENDLEKLKTVTNLRFAETWDLGAGGADPEMLMKHRQEFRAVLDPGVCAVTCAIDVQTGGSDDRFEVAYTGWGAGFERWELDHEVIRCDTTLWKSWLGLHERLAGRVWAHPAGFELRVEAGGLDTSDNTRLGYRFVRWCNWPQNRERKGPPLKLFGLKGSSNYRAPHFTKSRRLWDEKAGYRKRDFENLWLVGTHEVKNHLFARLAQVPNNTGGPGYWHIPDHAVFGDDWFAQLTSEHRVPRVVGGQQILAWQKKRADARNEVLDCAVYNLIAASLAQFDFGLRRAQIERRLRAGQSDAAPASDTPPVKSEQTPAKVAKPAAAPGATRRKLVRRRTRK